MAMPKNLPQRGTSGPVVKTVCPTCHAPLKVVSQGLGCPACDKKYHVRGGVPVFTESDEYWCNVDKATMHRLIRRAEETGWREAVEEIIPQYAAHPVPMYRGDAQALFPIDGDAVVLDAGSMWGGLSVPVAQYCKELHAVDKTWETLKFLSVRAKQMGLENVVTVCSGIHALPYADNTFDLVIVNGVLEWLGFDQELVLDEHWEGRDDPRKAYAQSPEDMQRAALREMGRVLKPGGSLFVAIENRIGIQYFFGHPDDHANVRFITFMPRKVADTVTRWVRNTEYRTYVYTPKQLTQILGSSGFQDVRMYSSHPHYQKMSRMTPFHLFDRLKARATEGYWHPLVATMSQVWRKFPGGSAKHVSPSLVAFASKGISRHPPRLLGILEREGLIDSADRYDGMLVNNRFGNHNPAIYAVVDRETAEPKLFCKVARQAGDTHLAREAEMISYAMERLEGSDGRARIPALLHFGVHDGMALQVTAWTEGRAVGAFVADALRQVHRVPHPAQAGLLLDPVRALGRRRWLKVVGPAVLEAVSWLAEFHRATTVRVWNTREHGDAWLDEVLTQVHRNGYSHRSLGVDEGALRELFRRLDADVPVCMQHGDFDICNLMWTEQGLAIVDLEHAEREGNPFLDLANILFSTLVREWRYGGRNRTLRDYAEGCPWGALIAKCARRYAEGSGLPLELVMHLPVIGALVQNGQVYPESRDPADYPVYGADALTEMARWARLA